MRCALAIVLALLSADAWAGCTSRDKLSGQDKALHFVAGGVVGMAVTLQTESAWAGFAAGAALGLAKELADSGGGGVCSAQDALATAIGAAVGARVGLMLIPMRGGGMVAYHRTF